MTATIEAVIWDFGGVFTSSPFDAFNRYEAERGLPRDFLRGVNARNPDANAWARIERAEIDAAAFDLAFAEESAALGHRVPGAEVLALLAGDLRPRVVAALEGCKAKGLKTGCITNNAPVGKGAGMSRDAAKAAAVAEVLAKFDAVIESSKAGLRKPDPRIYAMMCETLGVAPERCVYLDDLGVNLKPAREMGMATIKVVSEAQLLADLAAALGFAPEGAGR
jgi:putative hydrolase of the HAD superfamily